MPFLPFSDEQLSELATKFPRIAVVRGKAPARARWLKPDAPDPEPPFEVVFRAPKLGESDAFEGGAHDAKAQSGALRRLARQTVVGVSFKGIITVHEGEGKGEKVHKAWDALRDDYPGVHIAAQDEIRELNGMARDDQGKD